MKDIAGKNVEVGDKVVLIVKRKLRSGEVVRMRPSIRGGARYTVASVRLDIPIRKYRRDKATGRTIEVEPKEIVETFSHNSYPNNDGIALLDKSK